MSATAFTRSVFMWQDGAKVYLVGVDNSANGNLILHHDNVVKEIRGTQTMIADYWDAGYVKLDVDDPFNPEYLGDTSFDGPDPLTGLEPPEGNAHQAEFSADNRWNPGCR